jgi:predicted ribosome quality control (RQC) complex YloA/Tae2 family protein
LEGLLIAEEISRLREALPSQEGSWRFPDAHTFVLRMGEDSLWLWIRPPYPEMAVSSEAAKREKSQTGFQRLLRAKAVGSLILAEQRKLDRVVVLSFAAGSGFVPTSPVRLVVELTGRNCNLVLIDEGGIILGVARDVDIGINRFRQLGRGIRYRPPPPYQKLDPLNASCLELTEALRGKRLREIRSIVDGIGPKLTEIIGRVVNLGPKEEFDDRRLAQLLPVLRELARHPTQILKRVSEVTDLAMRRAKERHLQAKQKVEKQLLKRVTILERQLSDIDRARKAAEGADQMKQEGDLLLAYAQAIPEGAERATLIDFDGEERSFLINSHLSPVENAQIRYAMAKRRRERLDQAKDRETTLRRNLAVVQESLKHLDDLPVEALEDKLESSRKRVTNSRNKSPGLSFRSPHEFLILVGRNSRENDEITFKLAKSLDVWLHVQGYRGSHVLIQAQNREVPFDTILLAASLAAGYSQARNSENVAVDYAFRKNVWRVKGMPKGTVHFSHQKTVYVDPIRKMADKRIPK